MDFLSELKQAIRSRDVKKVRELFFHRDRPEIREGLFREDQLWDFKEECPSPSRLSDGSWPQIAADVAAFYNQEGGVLFFGIRDKDFKFVGTAHRIDTKAFNDKIRRYVGDRFWVSFSREFIQSNQRYLGIAIIPPRSVDHVRMLRDSPPINGKPLFKTGDLCIRIGDQTRIFRGSEAIKYAATKGLGASGATFIIDESNYRILRPDYKHFVVRQKLCNQVEEAMESQRTYVTSLTGIGGMGKTALACWMTLRAYEKKAFDFIVSVSARDRALTSSGIIAASPTLSSLSDLLREICELTGFTEILSHEDEERQSKLVKSEILSQFTCLLFVDNLETVDDPRLVTFLEDLPIPAKAIVTSRKAKIRIANFPIEVGPFDLSEAKDFLDERARTVGKEFFLHLTAAEKEVILSHCDRIPLVIEWLIGHANGPEAAAKLSKSLSEHGKHGEELLEFSFRRVYEDMTSDQRTILKSLSLINQPLPIEAVAISAQMPMHKAADVLEELKDYSLVERTFDSNFRDFAYTLLPVTSTFIYREMRKEPGVEESIRKRLATWYEARDISDPTQRSLIQKVRRGEKNPELTLLAIAQNYVAQSDLDNAEACFTQALERNAQSWQCHRAIAEFFRHQRSEVTRSLSHYRQAAEFAPRRGPHRGLIFREYGIVLKSSGLPGAIQGASEQLEVALHEMPTDVVARHALGDCYVKMIYYQKAIEVLKPLLDSPQRATRFKTYPLLERCYKETNELLELGQIREMARRDGRDI